MPGHIVVNPIWAKEGEIVDIHWRLTNGQVYVERRTCPEAARPVPPSAARQPEEPA